jgi:hypothetical protein
MSRPSFVLPLVGVLLLSASGILIWQNVERATPSPGSKLPEVTAQTRSRNVPSTRQPDQKSPGNRSRTSADKQDIDQINEWLADESVTPEVAAGNLWKLAADPSRSEAVREEALVHAMNLTDDETFKSVVIPLIGKKDLWTDTLGEKILDDLYNRPVPLKLQGTLALYQNSTGELRTNVRELLVFELGDPDLEKLSDAELIRRANERMNGPPEP